MIEIDHYSKQVAQLEERNYALESELEDWKNGNTLGLEEENERLEKEIARLEHSEEELKMEVNLLRNKR